MRDKCSDIRSMLKEYLETALEPASMAQIERHLDECAGCQAELKREEELLALFENAPEHLCSADLVDRLKTISENNSIVLPVRQNNQWRHAGGKVAAAVAVAALLLIVFWPDVPDPEPIVDNDVLKQEQIAGQLRWSMALTASYLLDARQLVETGYSEAHISEIINDAVAKGAESPFLNLRSQRNGG